MSAALQEVYDRLLAAFGPQQWWAGQTRFEILLGTILVQNASWNNVQRALENLRHADVLDPHALHAVPREELEELVRPAGTARVKAQRLGNLLEFLVTHYDGSLEAMFQTRLGPLREQLLSIQGIGPETADRILLYAGDLPSFVVDTATYRVMARHGWIGFEEGYDEIKEDFERGLPQDATMFREYHALLVQVGKLHCGKVPKCDGCPLAELLPSGGPREPD